MSCEWEFVFFFNERKNESGKKEMKNIDIEHYLKFKKKII